MTDMRPVVIAKINDVEVQFVADSGAFYSMMSAANAGQLKLPQRFAPFGLWVTGVGGGTADVRIATVKVFTVAGTPLHNVDFLVGGSEVGASSIGVLGQNLLHLADVEYDLGQGVIRLLRANGCGRSMLPYWVSGTSMRRLPWRRVRLAPSGQMPPSGAPEDAAGYARRGLVYWQNEQTVPAMADFDRALEIKSDYLDALVARAEIKLQRCN